MLLLFNIERIQERPSNLKFGYLKKMLPQLTFNLIHITESDARKVDLVKAGAGRVDGDDDFTVEEVRSDPVHGHHADH